MRGERVCEGGKGKKERRGMRKMWNQSIKSKAENVIFVAFFFPFLGSS